MTVFDGIETIQDVPEEAVLVTDSQDVEHVREQCAAEAEDFDGFFVVVGDGEYTAVWGFEGSVPYLSKPVWRVQCG